MKDNDTYQEKVLTAGSGWRISVRATFEGFWITAIIPRIRQPLTEMDEEHLRGMEANKRNLQAKVDLMRERIKEMDEGIQENQQALWDLT